MTRKQPFVLVTGGKGGVGKTTLALNLAVALGAQGREPLLVDLDLGLANLGVLLGVQPELTIEDVLEGRCEPSACLQPGPAGIELLPAGSGTPAMGRPDLSTLRAVESAVWSAAARPRLVIGDSAAGIGTDVLFFGAQADRVLVVTTPDPAAVTDAYGVIKALDAHARESGQEIPTPEVFVNLASDVDEARNVAGMVKSVAERFLSRSPRFAGWLPHSRSVATAGASREPVVLRKPSSLAARNLRALAQRVARVTRTPIGQKPLLKASECHVR